MRTLLVVCIAVAGMILSLGQLRAQERVRSISVGGTPRISAADAAKPVPRLPDGTVQLNGLMLVEEFNDTFGLNLSDPNYETIAGYVMGRLDRIPKVSDEVDVPLTEHETLRLRVDQMDGKRIARLMLRRVPVPES